MDKQNHQFKKIVEKFMQIYGQSHYTEHLKIPSILAGLESESYVALAGLCSWGCSGTPDSPASNPHPSNCWDYSEPHLVYVMLRIKPK